MMGRTDVGQRDDHGFRYRFHLSHLNLWHCASALQTLLMIRRICLRGLFTQQYALINVNGKRNRVWQTELSAGRPRPPRFWVKRVSNTSWLRRVVTACSAPRRVTAWLLSVWRYPDPLSVSPVLSFFHLLACQTSLPILWCSLLFLLSIFPSLLACLLISPWNYFVTALPV